MAAREMYDDSGLPIDIPDVDQTLTLEGRGGTTSHIGSKRVRVYKPRCGGKPTRVNFSGSNTEWHAVVPYSNLTASDAGTIFDFWVTHGLAAKYTFKWTHSDGHTYVVYIENNFKEDWR